MADKTGIEWTDATWNPIAGCNDVSEGCRHCYARGMARRLAAMELGAAAKYPEREARSKYQGLTVLQGSHVVWTGKITFDEAALLDPLRWKTPRRIFVNSMSDLFHEGVTDEQLDRIFAVMALCPQHTFQVLTKRPERMLAYLSQGPFNGWTGGRSSGVIEALTHIGQGIHVALGRLVEGPLPNVWLGVSVEEAKWKSRIDLLRQAPAGKRFLSLEPLLGDLGEVDLTGIDWVIVGGESGKGPGIRPLHPDWARGLRDQCVAAGVPFFFKQWGEWLPFTQRQPGQIANSVGYDCAYETSAGLMYVGKRANLVNADLMDAGRSGWWRVGKKAAGDLLDGVQWHQFPEVR